MISTGSVVLCSVCVAEATTAMSASRGFVVSELLIFDKTVRFPVSRNLRTLVPPGRYQKSQKQRRLPNLTRALGTVAEQTVLEHQNEQTSVPDHPRDHLEFPITNPARAWNFGLAVRFSSQQEVVSHPAGESGNLRNILEEPRKPYKAHTMSGMFSDVDGHLLESLSMLQ